LIFPDEVGIAVVVAQWLEHQFVVLAAVGSSPIDHPTTLSVVIKNNSPFGVVFIFDNIFGCGKFLSMDRTLTNQTGGRDGYGKN
jgi:hypothetical protein